MNATLNEVCGFSLDEAALDEVQDRPRLIKRALDEVRLSLWIPRASLQTVARLSHGWGIAVVIHEIISMTKFANNPSPDYKDRLIYNHALVSRP